MIAPEIWETNIKTLKEWLTELKMSLNEIERRISMLEQALKEEGILK